MSDRKEGRTVVQHSGYGYAGDLQFSGGLESRSLYTKAQVDRVERIGGVVFDDYLTAERFCEYAMYEASGATGLIPKARAVGEFDKLEVDELKIFKPNAHVVQNFLDQIAAS